MESGLTSYAKWEIIRNNQNPFGHENHRIVKLNQKLQISSSLMLKPAFIKSQLVHK
jgi:hypothetical protein